MSLRCSEPDLQMALLSDARELGTLAPDLAEHLEGCAACQEAVLRTKRMASVWMGDEVEPSEIATAHASFRARRASMGTPRWFELAPYASAGIAAGYLLLMGTGSVSAPWSPSRAARLASEPPTRRSSAVVERPVPSSTVAVHAPRSAPAFATDEESAKRVRASAHLETARGVAPLVDGLRLELKRGESARVTLQAGSAANVEGPCLVEIWSAPMEASGWRMVREEVTDSSSAPGESVSTTANSGASTARPPDAPAGASSSPRSLSLVEGVAAARGMVGPDATQVESRAWARAAAALRADDFDGADRAFDELGRASDSATRDAARLARAQLWISRGREAEVRPVLQQLAEHGATALVRQRAAEFLNRDSR